MKKQNENSKNISIQSLPNRRLDALPVVTNSKRNVFFRKIKCKKKKKYINNSLVQFAYFGCRCPFDLLSGILAMWILKNWPKLFFFMKV